MVSARGKSKSGQSGAKAPRLAEPILIGLGANLPSPVHGSPSQTLEAALHALARRGLEIPTRSRWWESAPVPASDQPWYINGVAELAGAPDPEALLAVLHEVEAEFGRLRSVPNAPRILDLDLLAYGDLLRPGPAPPILPHPRLAERAFVLRPLAEIRPGWRHPSSGLDVASMIAALPANQVARPLAEIAASR
jgi:2-amino-4-hydroxy-6-hydroxymethyldihydropteridine diphosphokinase